MAKNEIYGIYDDSTEAFVQFLPSLNEKTAHMAFEKLFKEKRLNVPMIYDYPNIFSVYKIGIFDDNSGIFDNVPHALLLNFGSIFETKEVCTSS